MDEMMRQRWWMMHVRVARGENLGPAEQDEYDRLATLFDREEKAQLGPTDQTLLRKLRTQIEQLQAEHSRLAAKSANLDRQTQALERTYRALTGYELAVGAYATS